MYVNIKICLETERCAAYMRQRKNDFKVPNYGLMIGNDNHVGNVTHDIVIWPVNEQVLFQSFILYV